MSEAQLPKTCRADSGRSSQPGRDKTVATLPNFFIVGAPKAGTDQLYYDLDQHPEVYMSPLKEPCFFSSEIRPECFHPSFQKHAELTAASTRKYLDDGMPGKRFGGIVSSLLDYQQLFSRVTGERAIGEGSVCYLWSNSASSAIASLIPHARIIIVLMDPSERAFHQYLKSLSDGTVRHCFRKHLGLAMRPSSGLNVYHPFLAFGNYFDQVRRYVRLFPAHRLNISLYEERCADGRAWFSRLLAFLGVESSFIPRPVAVPFQPHIPRFASLNQALSPVKKIVRSVLPERFKTFAKHLAHRNALPKLLPEDRAVLVDYYREDILKLQDLIGKDLAGWLR